MNYCFRKLFTLCIIGQVQVQVQVLWTPSRSEEHLGVRHFKMF